MTRDAEMKKAIGDEIRERMLAHYDLNPHMAREIFLNMVDLALSHYTLVELNGWLAILNLSSSLTACKAKVE